MHFIIETFKWATLYIYIYAYNQPLKVKLNLKDNFLQFMSSSATCSNRNFSCHELHLLQESSLQLNAWNLMQSIQRNSYITNTLTDTCCKVVSSLKGVCNHLQAIIFDCVFNVIRPYVFRHLNPFMILSQSKYSRNFFFVKLAQWSSSIKKLK